MRAPDGEAGGVRKRALWRAEDEMAATGVAHPGAAFHAGRCGPAAIGQGVPDVRPASVGGTVKTHFADPLPHASGNTVCGRPIAGGRNRLGAILHRDKIRITAREADVTCANCLRGLPSIRRQQAAIAAGKAGDDQ